MSRALGALHFYPEDKDPSVYLTFKLYEGENTIGSLPDCDVQLNYPDISEKHLQITLSSELEYSFEDLGSKQGVFKTLGEKSRQQLKPKKEYELVTNKPFYISNKYKCIFEAYEDAEPEPEVDFDNVETLEMSNNGEEDQESAHPTILMMENTQIIPSIPPIDDEEEEDEEETEKFESQKSSSRKKTQSINSSQKEKGSLSPKMVSQDLRVERKKSDNEKKSPSSQNFLKPEGREVKSAMKKIEEKENGKETKTKRQVRIAEDSSDGEAHYGGEEEKSPVVEKSKKNTNTKAKAKSPLSSPISTQKDEKKKTTTQTKKAAVAENGPKKGRGRPKKEEKIEKIEKIIEQGRVEKDFFDDDEEEQPATRKSFKKTNKAVQSIEEEKSSESEKKTETESSEEEEKLFGSSKSETETSEEDVKPRTPYFGSLENSRTTTDSFKKNSEIIKGENKKSIQSLNPVSSSDEIYYFGDEGLVASKKKQPTQFETDPESFGASLEGEPSFCCVGEEIIPIKRTPKSSKTKMEEEEEKDKDKYGMVSQELSGKKSNRNSAAKREDKKSSINGKRSSDEDSLDEYELASKISKKFKPNGGNDRALPVVPPTSVAKSGKSTMKKDSLKKEDPEEVKKKDKKSDKGKKQKKKEKETEEIESSLMINYTKRNTHQVMFSGIELNSKFKKDQQNLIKLGAKIVEDKDKEFSILVMNDFKRTIKFLLALSKGVDIVNYDWVTDSIKHKELLSVDEYIYKDKAAETKYRFNLASSLEDARNRMTGLLSKYTVYISPSIKPSFEELRLLVISLGGSVTRARPFKYADNLLIILNEDDKKNIEEFQNVGFTPYTSEVIYSAILQQKLSLANHRI